MAQEAHSTPRHLVGWGNSRLRDNQISFVSAGNLTREEPISTPAESGESSDVADDPAQNGAADEQEVLVADAEVEEPQQSPKVPSATDQSAEVQLQNTAAFEQLRMSAGTQDDSVSSSESEEEIVFHGRNNGVTALPEAPSTSQPTISAHAPHTKPVQGVLPIPIRQPLGALDGEHAASSTDLAPTSGKRRIVNPRNRRRKQRSAVGTEEEAIMQDYIANMAMDDDDEDSEDQQHSNKPQRRNETFRFYAGAGEEHQKVKIQSSKLSRAKPKDRNYHQALDWDSDDLEDFDDLATTDEDLDEIGQVLRHRDRPSGSQYLVAGIGQSASESKWMLHAKLTSITAIEEIRIFDEIRQMQAEAESDMSDDTDQSSDSEDEAIDDMLDDMDSEDNENDQILRRTAKMTDEQIARALAKQEELGFGGDEIMLFDGQEADDDSDADDFMNGKDFVPFSLSKHTSNRGRSKRNKRQNDNFPSAEAFADALDQDPYGGFDVMDFDRPSLKPKRKGRKSDSPFAVELSDEELAGHLRSTWQKDRDKKVARKREKMEEKQALLLDAHERGSPDAIKAEIRQFMVQERDVLKLAPMDSDVRAGVHRLAKALKLHSRSEGKEGKGAGRFPVLTKTPHTPFYSIDTIWEIDNLVDARKFFPKYMNSHFGKSQRFKAPGSFGKLKRDKGGISGASYMNGEVVGANAPELGIDNKGRAMLEKMGWTSGTGIGALGNKGNLDAIQHVFKTTKAGLG